MDERRKDFFVMLVHHVLTMTLIIVSYATRYHKIGILVVFVHDVTDILLEFTKCNVYLKNRNKKYYPFHEYVANIGFATFAVAWYVFRLYWFPLKILYSTGVVAAHRAYHRGAGLYAFFNGLLWFLLFLDLYWFYYIIHFLYKVATGQASEVNDTRDYDEAAEAAKSTSTTTPKKDSKKKQ
jgi:ceramide synthetase